MWIYYTTLGRGHSSSHLFFSKSSLSIYSSLSQVILVGTLLAEGLWWWVNIARPWGLGILPPSFCWNLSPGDCLPWQLSDCTVTGPSGQPFGVLLVSSCLFSYVISTLPRSLSFDILYLWSCIFSCSQDIPSCWIAKVSQPHCTLPCAASLGLSALLLSGIFPSLGSILIDPSASSLQNPGSTLTASLFLPSCVCLTWSPDCSFILVWSQLLFVCLWVSFPLL